MGTPKKSSRAYQPAPMDSTHVSLPPELQSLLETLARNVHEVWARQRMDEGWSYGEQRDDARKLHPDLVDYGKLSVMEQEYDRKTARETIKFILAQGYTISPPEGAHGEGLENMDSLRACQNKVRDLRRAGKPLLAYDAAKKYLSFWPGDLQLSHVLALALADSGALLRANATMRTLRELGHEDAETLSILGRTHKDLWLLSPQSTHGRGHLQEAFVCYNQAFQSTKDYYPAINAATLAAASGQNETALRLAGAVRTQCLQMLEREQENYYLLATLGEACVLLDEHEQALTWFKRAARAGKGRFRDIASTRKNMRILFASRNMETSDAAAEVNTILRVPAVTVFTGHIVDQKERTVPRFPAMDAGLARELAEELARTLERVDAGIGYASGAAGADLLFLESLLHKGAESHLVLPFGKEEFVESSVDVSDNPRWTQRFEAIYQTLSQANTIVYVAEQRIGKGEMSFWYTNLIMFGLAALRARYLETELHPIAVWDGKEDARPGSTCSTIAWWRSMGFAPEVIDIGEPKRVKPAFKVGATRGQSLGAHGGGTFFENRDESSKVEIKALLFADVKEYSKLREEELIHFVDVFMGGVAGLLARTSYVPEVKNTWGDGLHMVFGSVRDAGFFALELSEFVNNTDWEAEGFPPGFGLRISLHAGPVHACYDPVVERQAFTGAHVNYAARLEPVTPPDQVYASQNFAALAAARQIQGFTCEYVGPIPFAKKWGTFPVYHLKRQSPDM